MTDLSHIADCDFEFDSPIAPHTSFRIGGVCKAIAHPKTEGALVGLCKCLAESKEKYTILGNGTNVLFPSEGYDGVVVITSALSAITVCEDRITAGCGASITKVSAAARDNGLSGFEFAFGIPGSVGGAVYMNAGAYGGCVSDILVSSTVCDTKGNIIPLPAKEHRFGYRDSVFMHGEFTVLSSTFALKKGNAADIGKKCEEYIAARRDKQPLELPSAGSVFKRGDGFITSKVIDECGLKGLRSGGAEVSTKHAGFIVNTKGATSGDVIALIDKVRSEVLKKTGYSLECEIRIIR